MPDKNFTIVHIAPPQLTTGGDFVYRVLQPDTALGRLPGVLSVSATNIITSRIDLAFGADVLVLQMLADPDMLSIIEERNMLNLPTVFEISDNFMDFQPSNPAARFYEAPENRACLMQLADLSDAVQTSTPALAEIFSFLNPTVATFENRIESLGNPDNKSEGTLLIGWGGSTGHYEDIKRIAPALEKWIAGEPDFVKLSIMADEKFRGLFKNIPEERIIFRKPGSLPQYYDFVQELHIGIAPIENDRFNLCRSDVKFMEYASRGVVPVCSNVLTYNRTLRDGETGFLFDRIDEMIEILDSLVENPDTIKRISNNAHDYIRQERLESEGAAERLSFYQSLYDENSSGTLSVNDLDNDESLVNTAGTGHYLHEFTPAETPVYNGMVASVNESNPNAAIDYFKKAIAQDDNSFHAHLRLGTILADTDIADSVSMLEKALKIFPGSCETKKALFGALLKSGETRQAIDVIQICIAEHPRYAPGPAALAEYHLNSGAPDEVPDLFRKALYANRYFSPAMTYLGFLSLEQSDPDKAEELFREAFSISPRVPENRYGLGAASMRLGRYSNAARNFASVLELIPGHDDSIDNLMVCCKNLYKDSDYEEVISIIRKVVSQGLNDPEMFFWLAKSYERIGDKESATRSAREALRLDTNGRFKSLLSRFLNG